ncbi:hypothetical protein [Zavarzinella formosa]|uniref:hypothetical protein n=1 Tax=Zavarzinella formosa TaxID=360055 RepID=UPI00030AABCE|nr:hypothetical protein [Zavarzinella formosa]
MDNTELSSCVRFERALAGAAAGSTALTGLTIDTQGAERVCFVLVLGDGTSTGTVVMKAQSDTDSAAGTMVDIAGATTATATSDGTSTDNKLMILDIIKPTKRYVRVIVTRAVANHVVESVVAAVYCNRDEPVTQTNSLSTVAAIC